MKAWLLAIAAAAAGCGWARSTGDVQVPVRGDKVVLEITAERATLRFLNRGAVPVEIRGAGDSFVLRTGEDREVVLAGVALVSMIADGEGLVEVHFVAEGRRSFVHFK
jgi:hypothetical protein